MTPSKSMYTIYHILEISTWSIVKIAIFYQNNIINITRYDLRLFSAGYLEKVKNRS